MQKFTLHEYQSKAVASVLDGKHTLVKAPTGAGKTLVGVEAMLRAGVGVNLVVAPLNTYHSWASTLERQSGGAHKLRNVYKTRKEGRLNYDALTLGEPGFYFIGWELMRTQGWKGWTLDFVIADECHRMAYGGPKKSETATFRMMMTMTAEYKLAMSATPAGNKITGMWGLSRWLWPETTNSSFWTWATEMQLEEVPDPYQYKKYTGERKPGTVWDSMLSKVQMPTVYKGVPAIHEVHVELNATQRKHYNELKQDAVTWLDENPLAPELPAIRYMRLMEMTLATPSVELVWDDDMENDDGTFGGYREKTYFKDDAKSSKADAAIEIINDLQAEKPEPVLCLTHSRKFATFLTKRLQSKGIEARQFVGGMSNEERDWKRDNFGKEYSVLVATIQAVGEGTDWLKDVCSNEIWLSVSESRLLNTQAQGRLSRQGQKNKVNRFVLQAVGTVEVEKQHPRLTVDASMLEASYKEGEVYG